MKLVHQDFPASLREASFFTEVISSTVEFQPGSETHNLHRLAISELADVKKDLINDFGFMFMLCMILQRYSTFSLSVDFGGNSMIGLFEV
jgi:hypothetical protein